MKFILTQELGRLAKWLRILGFDAEYFTEDKRSKLIILSLREERVIITRSSALSRFSGVRMIRVKSDFVEEQIRQVIRELGIKIDPGVFFRRCVICNIRLDGLSKEGAQGKVPEFVFKT